MLHAVPRSRLTEAHPHPHAHGSWASIRRPAWHSCPPRGLLIRMDHVIGQIKEGLELAADVH